MQDGKALQAGTSHFLGQNFAKAFDVKFLTKEGKQEFVWATSWGVSTRLVGGLIMTHSDDLGLVLPPKLAPIKAVIVPIYRTDEERTAVELVAKSIADNLNSKGIETKFDNDDNKKPGWKFAEYEMKGVPLRIAIGPKDLQNGTVEIARRDTLIKTLYPIENVENIVVSLLDEIQENLFQKALTFRENNTYFTESYDEMKDILDNKGGFVWAYWDGTEETELKIKEETKATIRLLPIDQEQVEGKCIYTGKPTKFKVVFAKAY